MNTKKENIILPRILATGICVLSLAVFAYHGEEILRPLLAGAAECLMILLIYLSWKSCKKVSAIKSISLGTIALLVPCIIRRSGVEEEVYGSLVFLLMLGPVYTVLIFHKVFSGFIRNKMLLRISGCIPWILFTVGICAAAGISFPEDFVISVVWTVECIIMATALGRNQEAQWKAWFVCVLILVAVFAVDIGSNWTWMPTPYWQKAVLACVPFLYPLVFRYLKSGRKFLAGKYFGFCSVFYLFVNGLMYTQYGHREWVLEIYLYLISMSIIVFVMESKRDFGVIVTKGRTVAAAVCYGGVCLLVTIAGNSRLREIIYNCGGPALGIHMGERADWIEYRLAAAKTFLTGDISILEGVCRNSGTDSYMYFTYGSSLNVLIFQTGAWLLIIFAVLILVLWAVLSRGKWGDQEVDRLKKYFAAGCLIRFLISMAAQIFMFHSWVFDIPFVVTNMMDLMILELLWSENRRKESLSVRLLNAYHENFTADEFYSVMQSLTARCTFGDADIPRDAEKASYWKSVGEGKY